MAIICLLVSLAPSGLKVDRGQNPKKEEEKGEVVRGGGEKERWGEMEREGRGREREREGGRETC